MAYVVETAGGAASDGERSLLEVEPDSLHGRVPVHVGNEALVDRLERALS
jgi:fructose-1,6-bisphosphatase I